MPSKFTFKNCDCYGDDAICSCYETRKYEYLKTELTQLQNKHWCGDDIRDYITELLIEVEKPYKDAKIPE